MSEQLDRMEDKIDKMGDKLDSHLERIAAAETSIEWIKGHITLLITAVVSALGGTLAYILYNLHK